MVMIWYWTFNHYSPRPHVVREADGWNDVLGLAFHCRASFDGRNTQRMMAGSSIRCTTSLCALPVINLAPLDNDWRVPDLLPHPLHLHYCALCCLQGCVYQAYH